MIDNYSASMVDSFTLSNSDYRLHSNVYTVEGKCVNIWKMMK